MGNNCENLNFMIRSIFKILFSTKLTAGLLFVFAFSIGIATFIENDFGTPASKALVFNTHWFELVIILLGINLVGNIFIYKMFQKAKIPTLIFHISLIIIIIGAGITRHISYEGSMSIREGSTSNTIVSDDTFFNFKVDDKLNQYSIEKKIYLNSLRNDEFKYDLTFKEKEIRLTYKDYVPNSIDTVEETKNGKTIIEFVTVGEQGRVYRYIEEGQTEMFGNLVIAFNNVDHSGAIQINSTDTGLFIFSPYDVSYLRMDDKKRGVLKKDTNHLFQKRRLYTIDGIQLVYTQIHKNVKIKRISAPKQNTNGENALIVDVFCNGKQREVTLFGGKGYVSNSTIFQLDGLNFSMSYGSKNYMAPFTIKLNKFTLEKYPGSMSPSSFESEVTLIDNRYGGVEFDQKIYMNSVLDYDGYRLFQSSYDKDEHGTILSVNHDFLGTSITYLGYFLMIIGMISTLIVKNSRFNVLRKSIKKLKQKNMGLFLIFLLISLNAIGTGQLTSEKIVIDELHSLEFGKVLVQDQGGRIKPVHTMASELVRKLTGKEKFNNQIATQVFLGMMCKPSYWQSVNMIKVRNPKLEEQVGAIDHYASFHHFFDKDFNYLLIEEAKEAKRKKPSEQNKYDKEVLKVDERVNICYMIFQGSFLRIFPKYMDVNNTWYSHLDYKEFKDQDSIFIKEMLPLYYNSINKCLINKNWEDADSSLQHIFDYQHKIGSEVIPPQIKIDAEILYNKMGIFKKIFTYYGLVGLLMLFFLFAEIFNPRKYKTVIIKILGYILFTMFLVHAAGLGLRWYISGHAPWSNGHEAMLYVSWVTILAGFVFSQSSKMTIATTAILGSLILMVAYLNFMDPEITPLVPVLKSYWLMIHVAIITGSYGFLGLGALLGFQNLVLMIFNSKKRKDKIDRTIKQLTFITEMTLTVGLFMAAIGTFLGGVWANESWGRYWSWDPKETWALVIVLVYAIILHLRFIPKANNKFLFNLLAVLGFSSVLMTYFGVNYYLGGLHSYAKGDPLPIPSFVPVATILIFIIALIAYYRNKRLKA
ncbi:MAG: cytochrome C biogenesis protein [Flavobacteriales bacterium]|nr:MAG: cytochrome C biogenesis protein [Flavobacteriales bacterium]